MSLDLVGLMKELANVVQRVEGAFRTRRERYYDVDEFGGDPVMLEAIRPIFQWFYHQYWQVQVDDIAHVPAKGRALIVANHSGALPYDAAMIHLAIYNEHPAHRLTRFLVDDFVYYLPFLGTFINRTGGVRACPENAERLLAADEAVAVFPEGIKGLGKLYRDRYRLARFGRGGVARMALKTRAPIIPCAVIGAEEIHPILWRSHALGKALQLPYIPITPTFPWLGPLGLLPFPSQWRILFGKPIRTDRFGSRKAEDPLFAHTLTQQVRDTIQKLITVGLKKRACAAEATATASRRRARQAARG